MLNRLLDTHWYLLGFHITSICFLHIHLDTLFSLYLHSHNKNFYFSTRPHLYRYQDSLYEIWKLGCAHRAAITQSFTDARYVSHFIQLVDLPSTLNSEGRGQICFAYPGRRSRRPDRFLDFSPSRLKVQKGFLSCSCRLWGKCSSGSLQDSGRGSLLHMRHTAGWVACTQGMCITVRYPFTVHVFVMRFYKLLHLKEQKMK